jgi:hypothetical protein
MFSKTKQNLKHYPSVIAINKLPQIWWHEATHIYVIVLEFGSQK